MTQQPARQQGFGQGQGHGEFACHPQHRKAGPDARACATQLVGDPGAGQAGFFKGGPEWRPPAVTLGIVDSLRIAQIAKYPARRIGDQLFSFIHVYALSTPYFP